MAEDGGDVAPALEQASQRDLAARDVDSALFDEVVRRLEAGFVQRLAVAAQTALGQAPATDSGQGADQAVALFEKVARGDLAGLLVVGGDGRDAAARDVGGAHDREGAVEHVAQRAVILHLRCGEEDAVDSPLHHRGQRVLGARAFGLHAREHQPIALPPRLLLRSRQAAAQARVAEVACDQADGPRPLHDQAARLEVGDVAEVARRLQDAGPGRLRDRAAAVQHLARGLEADAGARRDVLHRDVPRGPAHRHAPGIMRGKANVRLA